MALRIRRGFDVDRQNTIFADGEIAWTIDTKKLYIGDGTTTGGVHVLKSTVGQGTGFSFNDLTQQLEFSVPNLDLTTADVAEDESRLYYTDYRAKLAVGTALVEGPHQGISFTYNSDTGVISATISETIDAILPDQTNNEGKWLTTNGTHASWATAPLGGLSFPSPAGHQNQFLTTTDGATLSWSSVRVSSLVNGAYSVTLGTDGETLFQGNVLLASAADIKRDVGGGVYASVLGSLNNVAQDTSPHLGGNLTLSGHNITGTGDINITGTVTASGNITSSLQLGGASASITGAVSAGSVSATGAVSGGSATITNALSAGSISTTGALAVGTTYNKLTFTGSTITSTDPGIITSERADKVINVGSTSEPATLFVNSSKNFAYFSGLTDSSGTNNSGVTTRISRGTLSAKTNVIAGDVLAFYEAQGYLNSNYVTAGAFGISVDDGQPNPADSGVVAGNFGALVVNAAGNGVHRMSFNSMGVLTAPVFHVGSFATGNYPVAPAEGMIIFNSTTKQFMGYTGSVGGWVALN